MKLTSLEEEGLKRFRELGALFIEHPKFTHAYRKAHTAVILAPSRREAPCIQLSGPPGVGKTTIREKLVAEFPADEAPRWVKLPRQPAIRCRHTPLLSFEMPTRPTVKSLARAALKRMGADDWDCIDTDLLTDRLDRYVAAAETQAILIDDSHRAVADGIGIEGRGTMSSQPPYASESSPLFIQSPIQDDEPLLGYLMRIASLNALGGIDEIVRRARIYFQWQKRAPNLDRLAYLTGEEATTLRAHGYWHRSRGKHTFGRYQLGLSALALTTSKICPTCLSEFGYSRRVWDLRMCPACPIHGTLLLECCPSCGKHLRSRRKFLTRCRCGHDFASEVMADASTGAKAVANWLSDLDRHGASPGVATSDLWTLCRLILILGCPIDKPFDLRRKQGLSYELVPAHAERAYPYLLDWPNGFHGWLEARYREDPSRTSLHADFDWQLLNLGDAFRRDDSTFVLDEVGRWLNANWRGSISVKRSRYLDNTKNRYVSVRSAARRLGMAHATIRDLIRAGDLSATSRPFGNRRKQIVDSADFDLVASRHASFFYLPEAAQRLGIGTCQVQDLIRAGYIARHEKVRRGVSADELTKLENRLLAIASVDSPPPDATTLIALSRNRHRLNKIIDVALAGRLPLYVGDGNVPLFQRIQCSTSDYNRESAILIRKTICFTALEAAKQLKVTENQVCAMQKRGMLGRRADRKTHTITPEIIAAFREQYSSQRR